MRGYPRQERNLLLFYSPSLKSYHSGKGSKIPFNGKGRMSSHTAEPGIYVPGIGGIRIEDDILVIDKGAKDYLN